MSAGRPRAIFATTVPVTLRTFHTGTVRALVDEGFNVTLVSSPGHDLQEASTATNTPFVELSMSRGLTPAGDARALLAWVRLVRRIRPTTVFAGTPKCALLAMVASAVYGVDRRVYICGGLRLEGDRGWRRAVLVAMERLAMACATEVVVNSRSLRDEVIAARLVSSAKVRQTLPGSSHGVDSDHFAPRDRDTDLAERLDIPSDVPVVGFVGRLTHDKGIDTLIEACRRLHGDGVLMHLLVVGPQDEHDSSSYVARLSETGVSTTIVGSVADVRPYFSLMTVHVLPSLREGFPNVVLEASAMGVPTVTTIATGCRDAVLDGVTGLLFATGDAVALAGILQELTHDPAGCRGLGSAAREWVAADFRPQSIARQIVALAWSTEAAAG